MIISQDENSSVESSETTSSEDIPNDRNVGVALCAEESVAAIETAIGYLFKRKDLLSHALTHKSFSNENRRLMPERGVIGDNETLEFLGDAVLALALSDIMMSIYPEATEGQFSRRRASLVNEASLSEICRDLGVSKHLILGRGELASGGIDKPRLQASMLEAILGAVFLDGGYSFARQTVERIFKGKWEETTSEDYIGDFKTRLQEYSQKHFGQTPRYDLLRAEGPEHLKEFEVSVSVNGLVVASASGRSKKQAEQNAAEKALCLVKESI